MGEFWGANVPKTAPREFPMGGGSWRGARGGGRVPFALARTRGLSEDLNSLFGVNGIHRAFMLSLVIAFVAFVALVAGGGRDGDGGVGVGGGVDRQRRRSTTTSIDDDEVRRRGRSSANDAVDVAFGDFNKAYAVETGIAILDRREITAVHYCHSPRPDIWTGTFILMLSCVVSSSSSSSSTRGS